MIKVNSMSKEPNGYICAIIMLISALITTVLIWYYIVKPKLDRFENKEGYVHFRRYRPSNTYRRQYWWKRPFLNYPFSFRRPFNYWTSDYYDQQPFEINQPLQSCKKLAPGDSIIPISGLGNSSSFSISFDMRFYPDMSQDDKLVFRVGQASPSPMMAYSPVDNTLAMILYTHFDGYKKKIIYAGKNLADGEWNNITWIQKNKWMIVYINNVEKLRVKLGSIPKISKGTFHMDSTAFVQYKNVVVCDYALKK